MKTHKEHTEDYRKGYHDGMQDMYWIGVIVGFIVAAATTWLVLAP